MVRYNHRTSESSDDLEQFVAIYIMIRIQSLASSAAIYDIRRVNERHGSRMLGKLFQHFQTVALNKCDLATKCIRRRDTIRESLRVPAGSDAVIILTAV